MERDLRAVVRPVSKRRFRTLLSVQSNLANLKLRTAVMQQRASAWVDFISSCETNIPFYVYNKVYATDGHTLFAYIDIGIVLCRSVACIFTDVGSLLRCFILTKGQCESLIEGISTKNILPRLFVSINMAVLEMANDDRQGECRPAPCVPSRKQM